jgi:nuclear autoantigenic sperm protein
MEKVKIYSALGEVALERGSHSYLMLCFCIWLVSAVNTHVPLLISEDIDNSLSDYMKALAMLEQLVEPDHRRTVELYPLWQLDNLVCHTII